MSSPQTSQFSDIPSREEFATLIANAMAHSGESRPLHHDRDAFAIRTLEQSSGPTLSLQAIHAAFGKGSRAERDTLVRNVVRTWHRFGQHVPADFDDAAHDLMPVVGSYAQEEFSRLRYLDSRGQEADTQAIADFPGTKLAERLFTSLAYDLPESFTTVTSDDLSKWGVDFDVAMKRAMENLRSLGHGFVRLSPKAGAYKLQVEDTYGSSRLLLPKIFQQLGLRGNPIVMVPGRYDLFVAGEQDDKALEAMLQCVEENKFQRRLGDYAYRLGSSGWAPWLPALSHRLSVRFRQLAMHADMDLYEVQSEFLNKGQGALADGPHGHSFVGRLMGSQVPDPRHPRSVCVWPEGTTSLLPKADYVVFTKKDPATETGVWMCECPWPVVAEVLGDMLVPQGMYPERYRVEGFPSDAQFAAMDAADQRARRKQRKKLRRKPR